LRMRVHKTELEHILSLFRRKTMQERSEVLLTETCLEPKEDKRLYEPTNSQDDEDRYWNDSGHLMW
jgi:hypothetical protein